jgi:ribonuclease BN (tRNA processing enzyme)
MELYIVGCHGGETPKHRASTFIVDETLAIDAGSVTRGLELDAQAKLEACLVSHAHLDHVRDLATLADNRCQMRAGPLVVAGLSSTIRSLKAHFFNGVLWPDFSRIPSGTTGTTIEFLELDAERPTTIAGRRVTAIEVSHTIDCSGFVVETGGGALAYSGDTGPTDRFWQVLAETKDLRALLLEVSFPNREDALARVSGHYTPRTLGEDLQKLGRGRDLPTLLYHIKPFYQREVEEECARLRGFSLEVPRLDDLFTF